MSDPRIPAALAPAVVGVVSLNDFMPRPMNQPRPAYTFTGCGLITGSDYYAVVPADLATIYNLNPLFAAGYRARARRSWWSKTPTFTAPATGPPSARRSALQAPTLTAPSRRCIRTRQRREQLHRSRRQRRRRRGGNRRGMGERRGSQRGDRAGLVRRHHHDFGGFIALQNILINGSTGPGDREHQLWRVRSGERRGGERVHQSACISRRLPRACRCSCRRATRARPAPTPS